QELVELNSDEVPFAVIEQVPVYKGCNKKLSNTELKKCMSDKISKHVVKNFNIKLAGSLGLHDGVVRVNVIFKIDKEGNITGIRSRAPHSKLEKEAIRVITLIPKMDKPGYQKGKPVIVPYSLPIKFNLDSSKQLSKKELRKLKRQKKKS
ncbi:MAG: hypothetical protein GY755_22640, partial [Chloroflexi bacterium]|nr:hypothetical protein [Chloroflexota bacterium]